jgi:hypothetical protein
LREGEVALLRLDVGPFHAIFWSDLAKIARVIQKANIDLIRKPSLCSRCSKVLSICLSCSVEAIWAGTGNR